MTAADVTNEETLYTAIYFRVRKILRVVLAGIFYGKVLPFGCGCFGFNGAELVGLAVLLTKNGERKEEKNQSI